MSHAAPTAKPAAGPATRACGHAACRKTLMPPLLLCSKCKAEAYCCKACQVGTRPGSPSRPRRQRRLQRRQRRCGTINSSSRSGRHAGAPRGRVVSGGGGAGGAGGLCTARGGRARARAGGAWCHRAAVLAQDRAPWELDASAARGQLARAVRSLLLLLRARQCIVGDAACLPRTYRMLLPVGSSRVRREFAGAAVPAQWRRRARQHSSARVQGRATS